MLNIAPNTRLRLSPFYAATVAEGAHVFSPYNRMFLPMGYGAPKAEYERLMRGVSMWDVACQRQIELKGPDAANLAQILSSRDLSRQAIGQGKYVAMCDHSGVILNDPIVNKRDDHLYWFSIADSDVKLWAKAIAAERRLQVCITEAAVSPLAVQGPKSEDVVASMLGDWVRKIRYFWFQETSLNGIPILLARSGYAKQGGFELYLMDESRAVDLWNIVKEAGRPYDIAAGSPHPSERIENGLLSCGGDTDDATNPFEVRLARYVDLDIDDEVIGIEALRQISKEGVKRHQLGIILETDTPTEGHAKWYDIMVDGQKVGDMTNGVWSWKMEKNIGFALISNQYKAGDRLQVSKEDKMYNALLCDLPFGSL